MAVGGMDKYINGLRLFYGDSRSVLEKTRGMSTNEIIQFYNNAYNTGYIVDNDISPNGTRLGISVKEQIPFEYEVITDDSNLPGGTFQGGNTGSGNIPGTITQEPGGSLKPKAGALNGLGQTVATVADRITLAVAGVNIGAKIGMAFDSFLYNRNPQWWDEHLPGINPETWNSLVGLNPVGDFFLRVLFGITDDNMTGYISADVLAYYYQMLRDNGAYDTDGYIATYDGDTSQFPNPNLTSCTPQIYVTRTFISTPTTITTYEISDGYFIGYRNSSNGFICVDAYSENAGTKVRVTSYRAGQEPRISELTLSNTSTTYNRKTFYIYATVTNTDPTRYITDIAISYDSDSGVNTRQIGTILFDGTVTQHAGIDGVTPMTGATQYPPTNITGTTPQQVKQQLQQEYPDLFTDAITEKTVQDDGTVTETTYVPIPWVTESLDDEQATTGDGKTQTDTEITPEIADQIMPTTQQDEPSEPPATGEGSAPVPVVPTGSASSLWAVYNPTQGQLNSFGAWLWSSDFVDQLKKLFADPMQAIIGIHKVFATPSTGGSQTIKCGYLDSGVSAAVVTNQYTTIDCGSASLREYFGNVFDYDPFTKVSIFLPFIGIVPLNTSDVMRSTISVKYKVDVITGACLAEVSIKRDGGGGILYTYGGSAIVTYPISSGSYVGAVQAALSTAIGIGSAIATGGASLGASAGMVLGGLSHAKTQVQHSGQFSGCSGAMGGKKPYLIVSRPQTRTPQRIAEYEGIPTNSIHQLSNCSGFTKVKEVHVVSTTAYDNEIQEIESLLKTGVIF